MKTPTKRFNVLNITFLRRAGLGFVFLLGCTAAFAWLAPPQSAVAFLSGSENPQPKQIAVETDANKKAIASPQKQKSEDKSQDGVWSEIQRESLNGRVSEGIPETARALELNTKALNKILKSAPDDSTEKLMDVAKSDAILQLPLPEGGYMSFRILDSPVMGAEMVKQFPDIKSYRGQSVDDLRVSVRADFSPRGFNATILTADRTITISPARYDDTSRYVSYYGENFNGTPFSCGVTNEVPLAADDKAGDLFDGLITKEDAPSIATGTTLRKYRFAVAATQEYYNDPQLGGQSYNNTVASMNTWVNAVNLIYERELAVRLLFFTKPEIVFTAEPDGLTNGISGTMAAQITDILEAAVGLANYDIGHVFGKDGDGGVAGLGVTCALNKGKGSGASGLSAPLGNAGSLKVLAHEIGHQFGAPHTWNACKGGARVHYKSAYEVGSGSTIMGYGGTCDNDNLVGDNDLRFHAISLKNMNDYLNSAPACAITEPTGNAAPVVDAGAGYTIPKLTPFALTASATDANNDVKNLTYTWEQFDSGDLLYPNPPYGDQPNDPETTTRPIFRAYTPTSNPTRIFPSLEYILNNANDPPATIQVSTNPVVNRQVGEKLPSVGRNLNFRVTARDNRSGGGGTSDDDVRITVAGTAGPFAVTAPNTGDTWTGGTPQTITWAVNGTNVAPVSAANVKISLSTDGGQTFSVVLADSVGNNGSYALTVPNSIQTAAARVKIEAVGNIFFDISDANFTINTGDTCPVISDVNPGAGSVGATVTITGTNFTGVSAVKFGGNVSAVINSINNTTITTTVPAGASSGAITLSKPGCGDKKTNVFSICASSPQDLIIDDGSINSNFSDKTHLNRLTPTSYPATLTHVQIYFDSNTNSNNARVGEQFKILAGTNTDGDTDINNTTFQYVTATVQAVGQFNKYALSSPITITSGDFLIGYNITAGRTGAADTSAPDSRSYYSQDDRSFGLTTTADYMVRGQYSTNCAPGTMISPVSQSFNASAGNGSIAVAPSTASTAWTATSNNSWITIVSGASGTGNGTVVYEVAQNSSGVTRTGTMTVAGQTFTVTQTVCAVGFSPFPNTTIGAAGGPFDLTVSAPAGCSWTATSNTDWLTIKSGATGSNNGTITYSAAANSEKTGRTGTLTIAGQTLTVTQTACPDSATMIFDEDVVSGSTSGTIFVQRLTPTSYPATLTQVQIYFHGDYPTNSQVMILAGKNEDGDANINNSIQQASQISTGTVRNAYTTFTLGTPISISSGDFVVGFKTVSGAPQFPLSLETAAPTRGRAYYSFDGLTFTNDTTADYKIRGQYKSFCPDGTISPVSRTISGGGGTGTVSVTASSAWTATSNDAWITVNSGASGTGNGTTAYTVAQNNTGAARTGSVTIAGRVFIVTQDGCGISFTPTNATINAPGGIFNIAVSTPAGCPWTAATSTPWITINSGASGTGSGTIRYTVPRNSEMTSRTGAITISGQILPVTQVACPGNLETMIFDDEIVTGSGSGGYNAVRLTPAAYPATLRSVQIYLSDNWGTTGRSLTIIAGKKTDGGTNINGSIEQEFAANSGTIRNSYATFTLPTPITISKGDFVVGFKVAEASGFFPLAIENTAPINGRSYYWNGATFVNVMDSDFKIRGQFTTDCPSGSISSSAPPSFSNSGGSGTVNVTADGAWTAFSDDDWITITGDTNRANDSTDVYNGMGNGTVNYTVAPNTSGVARIGSMSIAGNVFNVNQGLAPTAAAVNLSGRVLTSAGRGVSSALVVLAAPDGSSVYARTNSFGYYLFNDVPAGQSYVVTVQNKRYRFAPRVLTLNQAIDEFNMIAEP